MLQVIVAGRLTKDADLRYTTGDSQTPVLGFTVATDIGWGDKKHGVFVKCSLWGQRGEKLDPYLKKGTQVTVIGEGDLRKWDADSGPGAEITCKVQEVELQGGGRQDDQGSKPAGAQGYRNSAPAGSTAAGSADANQDNDFVDDDIPF